MGHPFLAYLKTRTHCSHEIGPGHNVTCTPAQARNCPVLNGHMPMPNLDPSPYLHMHACMQFLVSKAWTYWAYDQQPSCSQMGKEEHCPALHTGVDSYWAAPCTEAIYTSSTCRMQGAIQSTDSSVNLLLAQLQRHQRQVWTSWASSDDLLGDRTSSRRMSREGPGEEAVREPLLDADAAATATT